MLNFAAGDRMEMPSVLLLVLLVTFLSAHAPLLQSEAVDVRGRLLKSKTFLSPPIPLRPGEVSTTSTSPEATSR
jgi:hypothetical protein